MKSEIFVAVIKSQTSSELRWISGQLKSTIIGLSLILLSRGVMTQLGAKKQHKKSQLFQLLPKSLRTYEVLIFLNRLNNLDL